MSLGREGLSQSEPELVQFVRKAATAASQGGTPSRRHGTGRSDAQYTSRSQYTGRSYTGRSSQRSGGSSLSRAHSSASGSVWMSLKEMQSRVEDEALERYKRDLQKGAMEERKQIVNWEVKMKANIEDEKVEADVRRTRAAQNQDALLAQIEKNKAKRAHDRREFIENASSHSFPLFSETFINEAEVEAIKKRQKDQWREDLKQQMVTQELLKNIEVIKNRELVNQQKAKHLVSMKRERDYEQGRLRRQGKEMVAAWDKEIALKNFRKAIVAGVEKPQTPGALNA